MAAIQAWAAMTAKAELEPFAFDPGPLKADEVEVAVEHCGICHSDLSLIGNEWKTSVFPLVPGHEIIGRITALGPQAKGLSVGQRVGIGWNAESCLHCRPCMSGDQHLCGEVVATAVGHHGGFADRVRAQWAWVIPLPEELDPAIAGPLLCGGTTVFAPFPTFDIKPTARVGVVGIGGLGHMALQFANAWGCEVTAFTSHESKTQEAMALGAHHVVPSRDSDAIRAISDTLDLLLVTVNVPLDWPAMIATLAPKGRMHMVGAVLKPMPVMAFDLIAWEKTISGSPTGAPVIMSDMLHFAARHKVTPHVEHFPLAKVNDALARVRDGSVRYRAVLDVQPS